MNTYENESLTLEQQQGRAKYLTGRRDKFTDKFERWIDSAKDANTFLRGVHGYNADSGYYGESAEKLPEDYDNPDDRTFAKIDYALSRIIKLVQYIRSDEGDVIVQPEGHTEEPSIDPAAIAALGEIFPDLNNAEKTAKLLTARLDLLKDRSDIGQSLQTAAMTAASQRIAFCVGRWIEDEAEIEPFQLDVIKVGKFWFDPDAPTFRKLNFIGYEECKLDKNELMRKYGIDDIENHYDKKFVDIEHHYTRDFTTETRIGEIEGAEVEDTIYKYPYGWRYTVKVKNTEQILYDGSMDTPSPFPPIRLYIWNELPQSLMGVSVLDQTKTINRNIDRCMESIQKWVHRALPKIAVDSTRIDDPNDLDEGEAGGYLKFDGEELAGGIGQAVQYLGAGQSPEGIYRLADWLIQRGDEMIGATQINATDMVKHELSGDAIEGIEQSQDGIAGVNRDNWYRFLKDVYSMAIRFYMAYERETVAVKIQTPTGITSISANLSAFGFDDKDFESKYDVSVFSPRNMPRNPVKRAAYQQSIIETVMAMASQDPSAAKIYLESADVPMKQDLIGYVEAKEQQKAAEMMQALQAEPQPQDNIEYEARVERANDIAKSVSDGIEKAAAEMAKTDPMQSVQMLATIPQASELAYQQVMSGQNPQANLPTEVM